MRLRFSAFRRTVFGFQRSAFRFSVARPSLSVFIGFSFFIFHFSFFIPAKGQDSLQFFSFDDFQDLVLSHHPVAKQAELLPELARAELLEARGFFDPKIVSYFDRKAYKGLDYYNRFDTYLQVPTWFGIDLKAGHERNTGDRLTNPESPQLTYAGFSVPLGQNLLIDARRATLRQAELGRNLAEADRVKLINKVLFDAAKTYWDWYFTYQQFRLASEGFDLADVRFRAVARRAQIGDLAPVDSIEARITRQDRLVQLQQATVDFQNARLLVSNFLWSAVGTPLELPETAVPGPASLRTVDREALQRLLDQARAAHPELLKFGYKLRQLSVEERFSRNQLLPALNLNFNFLTEPKFYQDEPIPNTFLVNNHKFSVNFAMPLFLRKERGKLQQVRVKIGQTRYDQQQVTREILNDVQASFNDVKALENQINAQEVAVRDQTQLLNAERRKFDMGESSLFLVNARESKFLELRLKLEDLRAKYEKALAQLAYSAGGTGV